MGCAFGCRAFLLATLTLAGLHAQENLALQKTQDVQIAGDMPKTAKRLWLSSLMALSVTNVLDVQSSLGKRELNSALASSSGTLGPQGILLKSGLQGGLLGIEYLVLRRHSHRLATAGSQSKLYRTLSIINFASSGVFAGIAAHNYTVPRTRP